MIAHIIMSWLINFQVLNLGQDLVRSIWFGRTGCSSRSTSRSAACCRLLAGLDLALLVGLLAVYALRIILMNNVAAFY